VQLYLAAPSGEVKKPRQELKGFAKTSLLQPGASATVSFMITASELASFNPNASAWIADAGTYKIRIGASSEDLRLQGMFSLKTPITVEKCNRVLLPEVNINEITPQ
jgi:beta-glucosidase